MRKSTKNVCAKQMYLKLIVLSITIYINEFAYYLCIKILKNTFDFHPDLLTLQISLFKNKSKE